MDPSAYLAAVHRKSPQPHLQQLDDGGILVVYAWGRPLQGGAFLDCAQKVYTCILGWIAVGVAEWCVATLCWPCTAWLVTRECEDPNSHPEGEWLSEPERLCSIQPVSP